MLSARWRGAVWRIVPSRPNRCAAPRRGFPGHERVSQGAYTDRRTLAAPAPLIARQGRFREACVVLSRFHYAVNVHHQFLEVIGVGTQAVDRAGPGDGAVQRIGFDPERVRLGGRRALMGEGLGHLEELEYQRLIQDEQLLPRFELDLGLRVTAGLDFFLVESVESV
jgi:hypothetical protein